MAIKTNPADFVEEYFGVKLFEYQKEMLKMIQVRQCPKCGAYMTPFIKAAYGDYKLVYDCTCGYTTRNETCIVGVDTHIDRDMELEYTNHT